jgi:pimeloyl-ACP methyl ester carboxylesterase
LGGINFNTAGQAGSHPAAKRLSGRRRSGIGISLAALSLCGAAVIAGPEGSASAAATTPATSKALQVPHVAWSGCPAGQPGLTGFRCATIEVPLDYADPGGRKITLGLVEHPAATQGKPAGTLFFNPGGPDQNGSAYLPALLSGFGSQVVSNFNIVSWDPRGAGGLSTPAVQCFATPADESALISPVDSPPLTLPQQVKHADLNAQLNQHCTGQDEALLAHVSTADSARDLDLMRQALGQPKLSYYGISYGTLLGATYANMYPDRVGKMVLDGNIYPPTWFSNGKQLSSFVRIGSDQATAATLKSFLSLCGKATTKQCAFSAGSPAKTSQKFNTLLDRAGKSAIVAAPGQAPLSESAIVALTDASLAIVAPAPAIGVGGWSGLASTLQALWTASSQPASAATATAATSAVTTAAAQAPYTGAEQKLSVICGETPNPTTTAQSIRQADISRQRAGAGAQTWAWTAYCVNWPVKAASAYTGPWNRSISPILVVGNTGDPATSYQNSVLTAHLLPGARLVTVQGYGHTELANPSACAQDYIAGYLTKGALPKAGATCQQDATPFP